MRFIEKGPSIPDVLLNARDQGRVVFFCGAGVSRAHAELPSFVELTESVVDLLRVGPADPVRRILRQLRAVEQETGEPGLIPIDRIFRLLEQDFLVRDIERGVAMALKPSGKPALRAHKAILDLATTQEGFLRLVTTNFDLLFESCGQEFETFSAPRLPDPARPSEFDGLVYLHGRVDPGYERADGDGFVLSSATFGRAYISDGWATRFVRKIIDKYVVVFVGYAADDPPMQYLLEALHGLGAESRNRLFAFHPGTVDSARSRWHHKGVEAIAYDPDDGHEALWGTLDAWAERARNPDQWTTGAIERSLEGPRNLLPHERGQIAHIVSSREGARKFSAFETPPPADWLGVFDRTCRYATPRSSIREIDSEEEPPDPYSLYRIDSDTAPDDVDPENPVAKRRVPDEAWSAFEFLDSDRVNHRDDQHSTFSGSGAIGPASLCPRLESLGIWVSRVANQPAALWWAARKKPLHPIIRQRIGWDLRQSNSDMHAEIRRQWRYLVDDRILLEYQPSFDAFELSDEISVEGWSEEVVRKYVQLTTPRIEVESNWGMGSVPPLSSTAKDDLHFIRVGVKYPECHRDIEIPIDWIDSVVTGLRRQLESAVALEVEIDPKGFPSVCSLRPPDGDNLPGYQAMDGLDRALGEFTRHFDQLVQSDMSKARREFQQWESQEDEAFVSLRVWAATKPEVALADDIDQLFLGLTDEVFWNDHRARDLMFLLKLRWSDLTREIREHTEARLLRGPEMRPWRSEAEHAEFSAWLTLDRINWLSMNGCDLALDVAHHTERLRKIAPRWKPSSADATTEPRLPRGGSVKTNTEHAALLDVPLGELLEKADELRGRQEQDFLVENDPFAGLCAEHPDRACAALEEGAERGQYLSWAWRTFLVSPGRKDDGPLLKVRVGEGISKLPDSSLEQLVGPASDWLSGTSESLILADPDLFYRVGDRLVRFLRDRRHEESKKVRSMQDWTTAAINAPAGKIAQALFKDPRTKEFGSDSGFPPEWLRRLDSLLELDGDGRRHALVIVAHNLEWFFSVDSEWTERRVLAVLEGADTDSIAAFWSGFFWGANVPNRSLYVRLKRHLINIAKSPGRPTGGRREILAGILLAGWRSREDDSGERYVSDEEMCDVLLAAGEDFRSETIRQIDSWSRNSTDEEASGWSQTIPEFINRVWPRQKSVRSPSVSSRLFDLAFVQVNGFVERSRAILPMIDALSSANFGLPNLRRNLDSIVKEHPEDVLSLLDSSMPGNPREWPEVVVGALAKIGESDPKLNSDERLVELRRRWNSA